jgi:hypothetical protein
MREGITVQVIDADRARLVVIVADRNSPKKHLASADRAADGTAVHDRTVALTLTAPPAEVTHWAAAMWPKHSASASARCSASGARARTPTASGAPVQAVLRSAVRRQAARYCRSLCRSAGACGRLVARREVANPSA